MQGTDLRFFSLRIDCRWVQLPSCYSAGESETSKYIKFQTSCLLLLSSYFFSFPFPLLLLGCWSVIFIWCLWNLHDLIHQMLSYTQYPVCLIYIFGGKLFLWFGRFSNIHFFRLYKTKTNAVCQFLNENFLVWWSQQLKKWTSCQSIYISDFLLVDINVGQWEISGLICLCAENYNRKKLCSLPCSSILVTYYNSSVRLLFYFSNSYFVIVLWISTYRGQK